MSSHLVLRLPNVRLSISGDVPPAVARVLGDLTDADLYLGPDAVDVSVRVERSSSSWRVGSDSQRFPSTTAGPNDADLLDVIVARCNRLAFDLDPNRLHLHGAAVTLDGAGVLLAGPSGSGKSTVALELVRAGAGYLGDESVAVLPGSATVYAYPKPVTLKAGSLAWAAEQSGHPAAQVEPARNGRGHLRAGDVGTISTYARTGIVVVLRHRPDDAMDLRTIEPATAAVRLLADSLDGVRLGPGALEAVAPVVAGASCWELDYADAREAVEVISELRPARRRQISVPFRLAVQRPRDTFAQRPESPASQAESSSDGSTHMVQIGRSAALMDGPTRTLSVLEGDQVRHLTDPDDRRQVDDEIDGLHRELGGPMSVSYLASSWAPDAFALPARSLDVANAPELAWADARALVAGRASGVGLEQLERGRGSVPEVAQYLKDKHVAGQATCALLEGELPRVVVLRAADVSPVLLKGPVSAHDAPLPLHMRDYGDLDLLVAPDQVDAAVAALVAAGFERSFGRVSPDFDRRFSKSVTLRARFHRAWSDGSAPTFELDLHRTLAPGPFGFRIPLGELHDGAVPVEVDGHWYRALHPEHRFLHACVHVVLGSPEPRLHSLRDLVLAAPSVPDSAERIWATARRWQVDAVVRRAVAAVQAHFPASLPPELVAAVTQGHERAADRALLAAYHRGRLSYSLPAVATLAVLPSWRDRKDFALADLRHRSAQ